MPDIVNISQRLRVKDQKMKLRRHTLAVCLYGYAPTAIGVPFVAGSTEIGFDQALEVDSYSDLLTPPSSPW